MVRLLAGHPRVALGPVTSRTFAGDSVAEAHPSLRGQVDHTFVAPGDLPLEALDAVFVAGEHGQSMHIIPELLSTGFEGVLVDLSADFRFPEPAIYPEWFDVEHTAPELLDEAVYGLPEWGDDVRSATVIANPGCYATGITLALAPIATKEVPVSAHVTALTGASGSGAKPSSATHYPTRDGNVRPYKVLAHQHVPEVIQTIGSHVDINFVPASGPWTRGIWGTVQIDCPSSLSADEIGSWFTDAYSDAVFVRCMSDGLPSLQPTVGTPFCDIGWKRQGETLVIGFALDNLLKGAASQAVHNLNRALGFSETVGLIPANPQVEVDERST